jgi:hypothetical protein
MTYCLEIPKNDWTISISSESKDEYGRITIGDIIAIPRENLKKWLDEHDIKCTFSFGFKDLGFTGYIHIEDEEDAMLFRLTWS